MAQQADGGGDRAASPDSRALRPRHAHTHTPAPGAGLSSSSPCGGPARDGAGSASPCTCPTALARPVLSMPPSPVGCLPKPPALWLPHGSASLSPPGCHSTSRWAHSNQGWQRHLVPGRKISKIVFLWRGGWREWGRGSYLGKFLSVRKHGYPRVGHVSPSTCATCRGQCPAPGAAVPTHLMISCLLLVHTWLPERSTAWTTRERNEGGVPGPGDSRWPLGCAPPTC